MRIGDRIKDKFERQFELRSFTPPGELRGQTPYQLDKGDFVPTQEWESIANILSETTAQIGDGVNVPIASVKVGEWLGNISFRRIA